MDPPSHALAGALLGRALPAAKRGPAATLTVTVAAVLPDADVFFQPFVRGPFPLLSVHRGFTHSLLGVAVMAPLVALVLWRTGRDNNYWRLTALAALGQLSHIFLDLCTSWGTMVFYPFSRARVAWDVLFIIDFAFSSILLFPQLLAWVYRDPNGALRRGVRLWLALVPLTAALVGLSPLVFRAPYDWPLLAILLAAEAALLAAPAARGWGFRQSPARFCRMGLAVLTLYVSFCATAHQRALRQVEMFAESHALRVESRAALPAPLSPFLWSGLVGTPDGVYQNWFSLLDPGPPRLASFPSAPENDFIARARTLPEVKVYLWFARFPVVAYREEAERRVVEFTDLRFRAPYRRNPFLLRVVFGAQGEVLSVGFGQ